ncbi:MAG: hypothetical protein KatS3mg001_521 [Candidatus Pacearchaeota archaeon]|nr:MAG: hypothetical protein KatS3mg001_521 [Candidatus Pacearchaeota archaeon]
MRTKKGVSVLVSYVMLVVFVLVAAIISYQWLKTYVPREKTECVEGLSVFIKDAVFNITNRKLSINASNNGRFDVAGYFIYGSNKAGDENPSTNLAGYLNKSYGENVGNAVVVSLGYNDLKTGKEWKAVFDIPSSLGEIKKIRIVPVRFEEENKRIKLVSCTNVAIKSDVTQVS